MRQPVAALALVLTATFGSFAPATVAPAQAAETATKVVIIVGATHGVTSTYRTNADSAYAEARKYTSNVVKVYSPAATWSQVKAAAQGASILLYFGHGNGWPSPYTFDPNYTTKDGFGLNYDLNGDGSLSDYENKYYGEPSVASLALAPNSVVLLSHLCYASGNSEPGGAAPTVSVARQRVDNYAAGFLKSPAQAVIADGHGGPEGYIRSLFTTHQSIVDLWRTQANFHDHVSSFDSVRTPGATAYMDPDTTTGGYYRSLVAQPGLTTDEVVGSSSTNGDPVALTVPGRAAVANDGAGLYPDASLTPEAGAAATVDAGTRLRLLARSTTADGRTAVQVEGLDDDSLTGWMAATDLAARDSSAPSIWGVDDGIGRVSPNGDGRYDTVKLSARFSESVAWRVRITAADGTVVKEVKGSGEDVATTWSALDGSAPRPDGSYAWSIRAFDGWGNGPTTRSGTFVVDTSAPALTAVSPSADALQWFSPNGDQARDTATWTGSVSQGGSILVRVVDSAGDVVRSTSVAARAGSVSVDWNGRNDAGKVVAEGTYGVRLTPRDATGNSGKAVTRSVVVATNLGYVDASRTLFYPQDADRLARTTTLSFRLARQATVTWTIVDADGRTVVTLLDASVTPAGTVSQVFDGRRADGTFLPAGTYRSVVTLAGNGAPTIRQYRTFRMMAFALTLSDSTPRRGQSITVSATSAESLSTRPRVYVSQPGRTTWSVAMARVASGKYRASLVLKTGATGTVRFRVAAADVDGRRQSASRYVPLH
ncbi:MAG: FlgD immunoglobulin-like domain containing protein [Candidatus Limnocylindrales bacterium]